MRIYTLAKELGEKYSISVKSSDLADEIRGLSEFEGIRDSVKSHASSIDAEVADRVREIYEERHGVKPKVDPKVEAARKAEEEAKRRREVEARRRDLAQRKLGSSPPASADVEMARQRRMQEMKRRQQGQAGLPPLPSPRRPLTGVPLPRPQVKPAPLSGKRPEGAPTPKASPAPSAPASELGKSQARTEAPPAQESRPATAAPSQPKAPPPPPPPGPSLGVGGRFRADGQPLPPPPPTLSADSPLRRRPPGARAPQSRPFGAPLPKDDFPPSGRRGGDREAGDAPRQARRTGKPGEKKRHGEPEELVIPDIEEMSLKSGTGRGKGKPSGKPSKSKKKSLKPIGPAGEVGKFQPSKVYGLADEFRRPISKKTKLPSRGESGRGRGGFKAPKPRGPVHIGSTITLGEFAERVGVPSAELVKRLLLMGQPLTVNQLIDPDLCELLAQDLDLEVTVEIEGDEQDIETYRPEPDPEQMVLRPPVVTIMGHVDHGKTTLLDAFRLSTVVESEHGGITQHIGAYHVTTDRGTVVFLDTPGHAAFSSMRARGAGVTDMVVLVVAADDGVKPQTVEAINHAKEAQVPIIVAINKMDVPGADPQRVRTELMQYSILPEELGGENIFVEISAKQRTNLDQLLEMIVLQGELMELKADPTTHAEGVIIESHMDPHRGAVATVLVRQGTLQLGDVFVVGSECGRVRVMADDRGQKIKEAGPSMPVEVIGMSGSPEAGEIFLTMEEERIAREIADRREHRHRVMSLSGRGPKHVSLEGLHDMVSEGKIKELKVILKADVQGSLEAVAQSLEKLSNEEVTLRILHKATGGIVESDITLANASDAIVVGFNVRPDPAASALADREGIEIKTYRIIYELIDEFQKAIIGMLDKRFKEVEMARVEIRQIFKMSRIGNIAGCMVLTGELHRHNPVRLVRDGQLIYEGKLSSLRRVKDDVSKVASGFECGLTLENFQDIKEGDILESYKMEEVPAELAMSS